MRSKFGSTVLACLLYSQALFGFAAVAAVIMKDRVSDPHAGVRSTLQVATASDVVVR